MGGQGGLALGGEQALGGELFLQGLEGQAQRAIAGRFDAVEDQLVVAATLEQRNLAAHAHRQAVAQGLAYSRGVLPEQCAAHLGVLVLEGEVDVAGRRAGEIGDFAFDPDLGEHVLEQQPGAAVELADGEHFAVETEALERILEHGGDDTGKRREGRRRPGAIDLGGQRIKLRGCPSPSVRAVHEPQPSDHRAAHFHLSRT